MTDVAAPAAARDRTAILLVLTAMFAFGVQDAMIKVVLDGVTVWQTQLIRALIAAVVLALAAAWLRRRAGRIATGSLRWPMVRALLLSASYLLFYASLPFLTLTEAAAAYYVSPLLIMGFAAWSMGERIGPRKALAAAVGFFGVLLVIRPGTGMAQPAAILPILAAAAYALGVVVTRWKCREEGPLALMTIHNLTNVAVGLAGVLIAPLVTGDLAEGWRPISTRDWALLFATTAAFLTGAWCALSAYQRADATRLAPFEFAYLLAPPTFDLLIWGRLPDLLALVGLALIALSGLLVATAPIEPDRRRGGLGAQNARR